MKTPDKYRFTLQWGAETEEKIQAGNFLSHLGNRKSEFIVLAITEYLTAHPETNAPGNRPQIVVKPNISPAQLRELVKMMIEEKLPDIMLSAKAGGVSGSKQTLENADVDEMLKNLDLFSQN